MMMMMMMTRRFCCSHKIVFPFFVMSIIFWSLIYNFILVNNVKKEQKNHNYLMNQEEEETLTTLDKNITMPSNCTESQLQMIEKQLDPGFCIRDQKIPWYQRCSITKATKCPTSTWLDDYYSSMSTKTTRSSNNEQPMFLGISVGCNKGFDAINTMRMGTNNPIFDKDEWRSQMMDNSSDLYLSVCAQDKTTQYHIPLSQDDKRNNNDITKIKNGEMHCIEPAVATYQRLKRSADNLNLTKNYGFVVSHAAVANPNETGTIKFPNVTKPGVENGGINNCNDPKLQKYCVDVPLYRLDQYVQKYIPSLLRTKQMATAGVDVGKDDGAAATINILSIDVEGYDYDVLLGSQNIVLHRTEYIELEYNWMGSWKNQRLYDAITMLDSDQYNFTCYWAGQQKLWRITNCYLDYYDHRHWSNIACVSRTKVPKLAQNMEEIFLKTIQDNSTKY